MDTKLVNYTLIGAIIAILLTVPTLFLADVFVAGIIGGSIAAFITYVKNRKKVEEDA